jgi:hypothetical protein
MGFFFFIGILFEIQEMAVTLDITGFSSISASAKHLYIYKSKTG